MSNLRHATLTWNSGLAFTGGAPGGTQITVDGDGLTGISPMVTLLCAAAGCTGADVVSILEKMRVGLQALRIEITGTRREEDPKRYLALHLVFHITAAAIDQAKARRAIDLSIEKYCSVMASLAPDMKIGYDVQLG
ncbi:MAG TPA: OsmC family protein [Gemmatimonadales bacterium]|nr:OsmC family protein [Gemmatimonadales bacterium]